MRIFGLIPLLLINLISNSQTPIEVYQSNIKIPAVSEEKMYFGFSEGDQIILNFEENDRKELKEVEVLEYPGFSKFMDYKTTSIVNKTLHVGKTGIYCFRFSNGAITGRICSIKIERLPKDSSNINFNPDVFWKTVYDTTYHTVQEKYISKSDTIYSDFYSSTPQISSQNALNGNKPYQVINFALPENTIAWSFYIGTGSESRTEYDRARTEFLKAASKTMAVVPGYGPMAVLALTGMNYINKVQGMDNVKYYFLSSAEDVQLFYANQSFYQYKRGDVINEASQMKSPLKGEVYIALVNDNSIDPIQVTIRACAVIVNHTYAMRDKEVMKVTSREVAYLENN